MLNYLVLKKYIEKIFLIDKSWMKKTKGNKEISINYNEKISSLARLLERNEKAAVCVCIYVDKEKNVWYSSNKSSELENFMHKIDFVVEMVNKDFGSKARENFFRKILKESNHYYEKMFISNQQKMEVILKSKNTTKESKEIINFLVEEFYGNKIEMDFEKYILLLRKKILIYLNSGDAKSSLKTALVVSKVSLYLEDFLNISNLYEDENCKEIIKAIKSDTLRMSKSYSNIHSLHCEQRMLEHISSEIDEKKISVKVYEELKDAVRNGRFTVSKFCCGHCYVVFRNLELIAKGFDSKDLEKLGNSCSFFPGWISPSFEENKELFKTLQDNVHKHLELIFEKEDSQSLLIENCESEKLVNQIIIL